MDQINLNPQEEAQPQTEQSTPKQDEVKKEGVPRPPRNRTRNRPPRSGSTNGNGTPDKGEKSEKGKSSRSRGRRSSTAVVDKTLKESALKNQEAHKKRLNPHYKLDMTNTEKVRITPLGGLGEIGGNITVIETEKEAIIVDIGMSFPDEEMHGVDILIPDFSYLHDIKSKLVAVIITHAHEDHIGAVPYFAKEFNLPIYGTTLPLAMITNKLDEHQLKSYKKNLIPIEKRKIYKIGEEFEVEWMHITHSIVDSSSLAVTTKAGTIIHSGDFKIDHTPVDGYPSDLHRLAYYGEKGVLCLLSDSTNSYNKEVTPSEASIVPGFDRVFAKAEGRILMSTFSSNIHRIYNAIKAGMKYNRKVCVIGRSMERNLETAMAYDYIKLPKNIFIDPEEVNRVDDKEVLIVTTGSQGEASSALFRMAIGEHRHIKIKPSDLIVLSARAIPGNESSISSMLNYLYRAGAHVANDRDIHVSGHASIEEQKLMLRLVNPKFFLPVHGEYNHVMKHKETAVACGVPERNILLMTDGDSVELTPKFLRKVRTVKTGKTYIDNQNNNEIDNDIVIDRQKLANEGIVIIIAQISEADGKLISKPRVNSFGLIADKHDRHFSNEIEDVLEQYLINIKPGMLENHKAFESDLRQVVRKFLYKKTKKYPMIIPNIFLM